ncbi:MAG: YlbF family regulator [Bacilli bacterium]|nr:YlbF family regulator [Bacilli bacterium]
MEKKLSSLDSSIKELKDEIISSNEYKEYIKAKEVLDNNKDIKDLIKKITSTQKKLVLGKGDNNLDEELDTLYEKLYSYEEYNEYIEASTKLNIIISDTQKELENYFNSLME